MWKSSSRPSRASHHISSFSQIFFISILRRGPFCAMAAPPDTADFLFAFVSSLHQHLHPTRHFPSLSPHYPALPPCSSVGSHSSPLFFFIHLILVLLFLYFIIYAGPLAVAPASAHANKTFFSRGWQENGCVVDKKKFSSPNYCVNFLSCDVPHFPLSSA